VLAARPGGLYLDRGLDRVVRSQRAAHRGQVAAREAHPDEEPQTPMRATEYTIWHYPYWDDAVWYST